MSNHQEISSFIWGVCDDILRGLFKPTEYGRIILPFVVLRRLDCVLEPHKEEMFHLYEEYKDKLNDVSPIIQNKTKTSYYNTSKYDLSRLKGDSTNVLMNFRNYVNGYSPDVREVIENFQLDTLVEKLHKNKRLYQMIDRFTEVDLHPSVVSNHQMGQIYEELLRRFSEMTNEESGDHYTPRDIVKLLVNFVFNGNREDLEGEGKIRSVFDPCCGTGGMLSIGKEWVQKNINPKITLNLFGQELNDITYSICKSDFLLGGEEPDNIRLGNSISNDRFEGRKFEYMITNPPFGVSWNSDKEFVENESGDPNGRFSVGTPRTSDGSLLFLQHLISKMDVRGSRIGIVFNGSPLFTGDSGSGESEIRKWIIENDWLECIVSLPDQLFFNTGITTYFWIVSNKKPSKRRGKVQLINGSDFYTQMKKSLGSKRKYITDTHRNELFSIYEKFEDGEFSRVYPNEFFGYTKITIEQPELGENGTPIEKRDGSLKPDSSKRDTERVPLSEDIEEYYEREVKPHLPDSWIDWDKNKVGYEINFTKYFYKYQPLRSVEEITDELLKLEEESEHLFKQIVGE
jgi:type I restriction enzyme M protein